jgi:hypothetical protein
MGTFSKVDQTLIKIARKEIDGFGHEVRHVFGYNPDVDSAAEETVWTAGGLYEHLASPTILTVSSTSANDTSAGTGARTIYILGINSTGGEVSETVILNGQTAVNTTHTYTEIQSLQVSTAGTGLKNAGNIHVGFGTVTAGVPVTTYGHILAGENQSLMGHITIPLGYKGYIASGSMSSGTEGGSNFITGRLKLRRNGILYTAALITFNNNQTRFDFHYPIELLAGDCIQASAESTANNEAVSCYFQVLLVKE